MRGIRELQDVVIITFLIFGGFDCGPAWRSRHVKNRSCRHVCFVFEDTPVCGYNKETNRNTNQFWGFITEKGTPKYALVEPPQPPQHNRTEKHKTTKPTCIQFKGPLSPISPPPPFSLAVRHTASRPHKDEAPLPSRQGSQPCPAS